MEQSNDRTLGDLSQTSGTNRAGSTGMSDDASMAQSSVKDRARELAGNAQEKLADVGSNVRERAGNLKDSLADALETGAEKLRAKGGSQDGTLAGATGSSSMALEDGRVAQVSNRVAGGMDATADWLRQADLDGLGKSIEAQVKEHPGRSLLIAAGLGYLLGKALRK